MELHAKEMAKNCIESIESSICVNIIRQHELRLMQNEFPHCKYYVPFLKQGKLISKLKRHLNTSQSEHIFTVCEKLLGLKSDNWT